MRQGDGLNHESEFFLKPDGVLPPPAWKLKPENPFVARSNAVPLAAALQHLIDDLPEQVALVDADCKILAVNSAWTHAMKRHGYEGVAPGDDYRAICAKNANEGFQPAVEALSALDEMLSGERSSWELIYKGLGQWSSHEFQLCFHLVSVGGQHFITITRSELTEILELRRLKDEYSKSLIEGQTVERRRLARELHDSTAQLLVAVGLLLTSLKRQSANEESVRVVEEIQDLMAEAQNEIRSISYLAHPPALEKLGLIGATNALVEGFARRTGLEATFDFQGEPDSISKAAQGAIYRVAQEALSNVHRHARATRVHALLCFRRSAIHLVIADDGIGISAQSVAGAGHAGVGLSSMRSRLAEIGGRASIRRLGPGTAIVASIPANRN